MEVKASYDEGHLAVAAIRVLGHRHDGRPPTVPEIAEHLKLSREWVGVLVSALEKAGVLRTLTGPFETRVEIRDHLKLEDLPRQAAAAGVDEELREFSERKRKEDEKLQKLFGGDVRRKQDARMDEMADRLKGWKPRKPRSAPFFEDPDEK